MYISINRILVAHIGDELYFKICENELLNLKFSDRGELFEVNITYRRFHIAEKVRVYNNIFKIRCVDLTRGYPMVLDAQDTTHPIYRIAPSILNINPSGVNPGGLIFPTMTSGTGEYRVPEGWDD